MEVPIMHNSWSLYVCGIVDVYTMNECAVLPLNYPNNLHTAKHRDFAVVNPMRAPKVRLWAPVLPFSKLNNFMFEYFDPESISLDNENK